MYINSGKIKYIKISIGIVTPWSIQEKNEFRLPYVTPSSTMDTERK
jgi:hypothetical protein